MTLTKLDAWARLIRFDKPVGTYLLLWPTLMALWVASDGKPAPLNLFIFAAGCFFMRSAGCAINDYADRDLDGSVKRTAARPLASGELKPKTALLSFAGFGIASALLVLLTNIDTILLSIGAIATAALYPFMKRYTHLPQVVLGAAFCFGIPMAFTASNAPLSIGVWLLWLAIVLWVVTYDTFYAMVDRDDDLKIGIKSTAVLFGQYDKLVTGVLQIIILCLLVTCHKLLGLGTSFMCGIVIAAGFFIYQQWLIRNRDRDACFSAFLNNHIALFTLFFFTVLDTSVYLN